MTEAATIRRLLADGWRYMTSEMELLDGGRHRPALVFTNQQGKEHAYRAPITYSTAEAAWMWADQWAARATQWGDTD